MTLVAAVYKKWYNLIRPARGISGYAANWRHGHGDVAVRYCGLEGRHHIPGIWMHGYPPHSLRPVVANDVVAAKQGHMVYIWSDEMKWYFASEGLTNYKIIGAPYIYGASPNHCKTSSNVAVFPSHSTPQVQFTYDHGKYAASLMAKYGHLGRITICLHHYDYTKPDIAEAYEKHGFAVVTNGAVSDPAFLWNLIRLLSDNRYVVTNSFSSVILYSWYAGCGVVIDGPHPVASSNSEGKELSYYNDRLIDDITRVKYPFLFTKDGLTSRRVELGCYLLGYSYMLSPKELRREFYWTKQYRAFTRARVGAASAVRMMSGLLRGNRSSSNLV